MLQKPEIRLLKGFASLNFGENPTLVKQLLGEPEEIQNLNDSILETNTLVFHYWTKGCSLFFDLNKNQGFCSAETDNTEAILFNTRLFSLKEKEIVQLLKENGFALSDSEKQSWGEKRLSFDDAGLDCYFENNRLVSVNISCREAENEPLFFPN